MNLRDTVMIPALSLTISQYEEMTRGKDAEEVNRIIEGRMVFTAMQREVEMKMRQDRRLRPNGNAELDLLRDKERFASDEIRKLLGRR